MFETTCPEKLLKNHFPKITLIGNKTNLGTAVAHCFGAQVSRGQYLFFLDYDVELTGGATDSLLAPFERIPRAEIASPKICYHIARPGSKPNVLGYLNPSIYNCCCPGPHY
ncbi:MAG: glycosyltransferase [Lewinellaceae bacterium]|nr:glycosyltransferase [Saprospiraceae bacterium]MCB9339905.1 glycosyltransferase [Lewinellaceae bacterium]